MQKFLTRRAACLLPVSLQALRAQPLADEMNGGFITGRFWLKMDQASKFAFLIGYANALWLDSFRAVNGGQKQVPKELDFPHLKYGETAKEIDLFYGEGANARIPIPMALRYVRRKELGDTNEQLAALAASFRRVWNH